MVIKHKKYLDMLKWEETDPNVVITPAFSSGIDQGIINENGNYLDLPARIHVNNALMLAVIRAYIEMVLAMAIEAIFVMMGKPEVVARQCPLAMGKWLELVIVPKQNMLVLSSIPTSSLLISHINISTKYSTY